MLKLIATVPWRIAVRKPDPDNTATRWATVPDGFQLADIEIWVDTDALMKAIGYRVMRSKRGVSVLQGGAITLKALNLRKEP